MGGGPSEATQQQQNLQLQSSQEQLQFNNQLMGIFTKQYQTQQDTLNYLQGQVKPIIAQSEAGQGMTTAAENAMRTSATDTIAAQGQAAQQALNAKEATQLGGTNVLPSGTSAELNAALLNSTAQQQSQAQNQITQYNASLANSNLWNALNVEGGFAAQQNPLGYAGAATGGSGAVAAGSGAQSNLQNSIANANNSGFFGSLGRSLGQGIGIGTAGLLFG